MDFERKAMDRGSSKIFLPLLCLIWLQSSVTWGQVPVTPLESSEAPLASADQSVNQGAEHTALGLSSGGLDAMSFIEEVFVTGSLLPRGNYESNAPIARLEAVDISASNPVALETILWELPQVLGGNQTASAGNRSRFPTIDLRGLGTNRTLTLLDGARMIPGSADGGSIDFNYIPHGFIESVELLTGGASTTYGSDAIAGVINIKTKDDFNGFEVASSFESSDRGDAEFENLYATFGTEFDDSRGQLVVHADVSRRGTFKMSDRSRGKDWNCEDWGSDGISGGIYPCRFGLNEYGVVQTPAGPHHFYEQDLLSSFSQQAHGRNDADETYLQQPLEREVVIAKLNWTKGPVTLSGRVHWSNSFVEQYLRSPWWDTNFEITFDGNPFLSQNVLEQWMNLDPSIVQNGVDANLNGIPDTATVRIGRTYPEAGPTIWEYDNEFTQFRLGLSYELSENWMVEAGWSSSKIDKTTSLKNGLLIANVRQALLLDISDPTDVECSDPSNGCVPANIYGALQMSEAAQKFITHDRTTAQQDLEMSVASLLLTGNTSGFFEMPNDAGPIGVAFGIEYLRSEVLGQTPSEIEARNYSVIRRYEGLEPDADASISRKSVYTEILVPLLQGVPWASFMELELGGRYAEEDIAGSNVSSKAALAWFPVDDLQIRASVNKSVRAPAPLEIYGSRPSSFLFGRWMVDPCSAEGSLITDIDVDRCVANGVPEEMVGSPEIDLTNADFIPVTYTDNFSLTEEKATTFTAGFVWTPYSFNDLSLSVDYFEIDIDDYIVGLPGGQSTFPQRCIYDGEVLGGGFWARISNPSPAYCQAYTRDATGKVDLVLGYDGNYGDLLTRGIDIGLTKSWDLDFGTLSFNYMGTILEEQTFSFGSAASSVDCAGKMNSDYGGQNCIRGVPAYKHRATLNLVKENVNYQLAWRHVGSVKDNDNEVLFAHEYSKAVEYLDFSLTYTPTANWDLFAGVGNLFDRKPPVLGDNAFEGNTLINMYDVVGRTYFAKVRYRI